MSDLRFQTPWNRWEKPMVTCPEPGSALAMTEQHHAAELDIQRIVDMGRANGGIIPQHLLRQEGAYGDFTNVPDFQTAQKFVIEAQEAFDSLPAKLRDRFHNNPAEFMDFVSNNENAEEAKRLGILVPEPVVKPTSEELLEKVLDKLPEKAPKKAPVKQAKD